MRLRDQLAGLDRQRERAFQNSELTIDGRARCFLLQALRDVTADVGCRDRRHASALERGHEMVPHALLEIAQRPLPVDAIVVLDVGDGLLRIGGGRPSGQRHASLSIALAKLQQPARIAPFRALAALRIGRPFA
jgi:hypothetical protein